MLSSSINLNLEAETPLGPQKRKPVVDPNNSQPAHLAALKRDRIEGKNAKIVQKTAVPPATGASSPSLSKSPIETASATLIQETVLQSISVNNPVKAMSGNKVQVEGKVMKTGPKIPPSTSLLYFKRLSKKLMKNMAIHVKKCLTIHVPYLSALKMTK